MTMSSSMKGFVATTGAAASSTRYEIVVPGHARFSAFGSGVVNTTSPIRRKRINKIFKKTCQLPTTNDQLPTALGVIGSW